MVLNFNSQGDEYDYTQEFNRIFKKQRVVSNERYCKDKNLKIMTYYDVYGKLERIVATKPYGQAVFVAEFQNDIQIKNETYHDNGLLAVKTMYNIDGKPILEENYDKHGYVEVIKTFSYYKNGNIRSEKIEDEFGEHEIRYYKNGQIAYKSKNGSTEEYDEYGLKTKSTDSNGNITRYKYDFNGVKKYELIELKYYM